MAIKLYVPIEVLLKFGWFLVHMLKYYIKMINWSITVWDLKFENRNL